MILPGLVSTLQPGLGGRPWEVTLSTPLPVIENAARVAHQYHTNDATFVNVFWLLAGEPTDGTEPFADAFMSSYVHVKSSFGMVTLHSEDVTFDGVTVTLLDGASPSVFWPYATTTHGGTLSVATAANACLVMTLQTDFRGRDSRGRVYLGGMPNAGLASGGARWASSTILDANDAVASFFEGLGEADAGYTPLVVSQRGVHSPKHTLVGTMLPRPKVGSQRRRTER